MVVADPSGTGRSELASVIFGKTRVDFFARKEKRFYPRPIFYSECGLFLIQDVPCQGGIWRFYSHLFR